VIQKGERWHAKGAGRILGGTILPGMECLLEERTLNLYVGLGEGWEGIEEGGLQEIWGEHSITSGGKKIRLGSGFGAHWSGSLTASKKGGAKESGALR